MDEGSPLEKILAEIRDSQQSIAEDTKRLREYFEHVRRMQRRVLIFVPVAVPIGLAIILMIVFGVLKLFGVPIR
jgi:hypothetical protein